MEELLKSSSLDNLVEGSIIKGTIIEIRPTEVVVDIGGTAKIDAFVDFCIVDIRTDSDITDDIAIQVGREMRHGTRVAIADRRMNAIDNRRAG